MTIPLMLGAEWRNKKRTEIMLFPYFAALPTHAYEPDFVQRLVKLQNDQNMLKNFHAALEHPTMPKGGPKHASLQGNCGGEGAVLPLKSNGKTDDGYKINLYGKSFMGPQLRGPLSTGLTPLNLTSLMASWPQSAPIFPLNPYIGFLSSLGSIISTPTTTNFHQPGIPPIPSAIPAKTTSPPRRKRAQKFEHPVGPPMPVDLSGKIDPAAQPKAKRRRSEEDSPLGRLEKMVPQSVVSPSQITENGIMGQSVQLSRSSFHASR
ncbi:unnamed protein product [Caenorhabditis sp. 36 PRJEB53466]|nr:unnamed protein product [Caenorhabditis sp. 36 PRJEB53466]